MKPLLLMALLLLGVAASAQAAYEPREFREPAMAERYQSLMHELRCTVCQNQSLADSNAGLAQDLRREVYTLVNDGASEAEVIDFMVSRYGEFVLYRPPLRPATYLLWSGPFLLLLIGVVVLYLTARRSQVGHADASDPAAQERARHLLEEEPEA
ncbi:cytochrome c-type biogenesis protein [Halomonas alkalisoli]|uniref:cytochrome c-type biogenesis protein n=1 Tax=Halomonas alkalisoli TaxID=2907158 RepID=UPI001F2D7EED|nr:cytochrome c-type biogenesis protein [Halomonas alkalisoli]MCE9682604.1 cytochrome c-type biogenesis protein CcmH [Halomonas alkalisoli]